MFKIVCDNLPSKYIKNVFLLVRLALDKLPNYLQYLTKKYPLYYQACDIINQRKINYFYNIESFTSMTDLYRYTNFSPYIYEYCYLDAPNNYFLINNTNILYDYKNFCSLFFKREIPFEYSDIKRSRKMINLVSYYITPINLGFCYKNYDDIEKYETKQCVIALLSTCIFKKIDESATKNLIFKIFPEAKKYYK